MAQLAVPVEDTLSAMLQAEAVPMTVLHARYGSLLEPLTFRESTFHALG